MGKNKTTKYDKMFINKIPLDQCVACGCKLRWCQVRVAFDENGKSIAHCQPVHICDNHRCPESPNFEAYLKGEYTPVLGKFGTMKEGVVEAKLNPTGKHFLKRLNNGN